MEIVVELNLAFYVNVLSNKGNLKNISGGGCENSPKKYAKFDENGAFS